MFVMSKNLSIKSQYLEVSDASNDPYADMTLDTVPLKTCTANLIFVLEYDVNLM